MWKNSSAGIGPDAKKTLMLSGDDSNWIIPTYVQR